MVYNFIEKAKTIHKDTYDYNNTNYINKRTKVTITCKIHGDFLQSPQHHLQGSGCKKCYLENITSTSETFILKATEVHQDKYNYSKVSYTKSNKKVIIICPLHGEFEQEANSHLQGKGCKSCYNIDRVYDLTSFINKANQVHNNTYTYSKSLYKDSIIEIIIICKTHGPFKQTPNSHLDGCGCPTCGKLFAGHSLTSFINQCNINNNGVGTLYVIRCFNELEEFYKIGITSKSIKERFKCKLPYNYEIIQDIKGDPSLIFKLEKYLHKGLMKFKYFPELYFNGNSECFKKEL